MMTSVWTDERVEKLRSLWAEGLSASSIAGIFGDVTRNAVIGKVHRLKLSGRKTLVADKCGPRRKARPPGRLPVVHAPAIQHQPSSAVPALPAKPQKQYPPGPVSMADMPMLGRCRNPLWPTAGRCPPYERMMFCGDAVKRGRAWCPKCAAVLGQGVLVTAKTQAERLASAPRASG